VRIITLLLCPGGVKKLQEYDVVVVGAGPAGLTAAGKAAEAGATVLLMEKDPTLGKKACGEAISASTIEDAEVSHQERFICNKIRGVFCHAPDEKERIDIYSGELGFGEGYILEKSIFLRELANQASQKGVDIWVRTEALDLQRKDKSRYILALRKDGKELSVQAKKVLGCGGVNSIVAKKFFTRENYELIPCIQYKMVNCRIGDASVLETYVGQDVAPLGYAWVFPKNEETANVGIGVRGAPAKPYLDRFISNHPETFRNASIVEVQAAPVPVGGQIKKVAQDGVMVCGDAAGQVIPLTGGGIHASIAAGKIAGELAGKAVTRGEVDPIEYPKRYLYWSRRIDNSLLSLRLIEKLNDGELNKLAGILTGQDLLDLAGGLDIERVGKKLLKHPGFVNRLAEALMGK